MGKRKRTPLKKSIRRKRRNVRGRSSLAKAIRRIAYKSMETKSTYYDTATGPLYDFTTINHNVSQLVFSNMLATYQGTADGTANANRIGDEITPIGIKFYIGMKQFADRPNLNWKFWIIKRSGNTVGTSVPVKTITGNLMMDPIDTELVTCVKIIKHKAPDNYWSGSLATSKEYCTFRSFYLKLPKKPYKYRSDGSDAGKSYQLSLYVAAYDTTDSLITSNVGKYRVSYQLFFKDG